MAQGPIMMQSHQPMMEVQQQQQQQPMMQSPQMTSMQPAATTAAFGTTGFIFNPVAVTSMGVNGDVTSSGTTPAPCPSNMMTTTFLPADMTALCNAMAAQHQAAQQAGQAPAPAGMQLANACNQMTQGTTMMMNMAPGTATATLAFPAMFQQQQQQQQQQRQVSVSPPTTCTTTSNNNNGGGPACVPSACGTTTMTATNNTTGNNNNNNTSAAEALSLSLANGFGTLPLSAVAATSLLRGHAAAAAGLVGVAGMMGTGRMMGGCNVVGPNNNNNGGISSGCNGSIMGGIDDPSHQPVAEFLYQLTRMLVEDNRSVIEWNAGRIVVHDPHLLEKDILHNYFRHSKFSSFQRQLNYFGFRKLAGKGKMAPCSYVNNDVTSDLRSLLTIKRKNGSGKNKKKDSAESDDGESDTSSKKHSLSVSSRSTSAESSSANIVSDESTSESSCTFQGEESVISSAPASPKRMKSSPMLSPTNSEDCGSMAAATPTPSMVLSFPAGVGQQQQQVCNTMQSQVGGGPQMINAGTFQFPQFFLTQPQQQQLQQQQQQPQGGGVINMIPPMSVMNIIGNNPPSCGNGGTNNAPPVVPSAPLDVAEKNEATAAMQEAMAQMARQQNGNSLDLASRFGNPGSCQEPGTTTTTANNNNGLSQAATSEQMCFPPSENDLARLARNASLTDVANALAMTSRDCSLVDLAMLPSLSMSRFPSSSQLASSTSTLSLTQLTGGVEPTPYEDLK